MQKDGIKVEGYVGKWHVIDETMFRGEQAYLVEHETYGDEAACLIINEKKDVILDGVWNGFLDLAEAFDDYKEEWKMKRQNMSEEEMRGFSNEILPLLGQIDKIVKENKVESGISIWISDGYVSVDGSGLCGWELNIYDGKPEMKFEKRVPLGEVKADAE